MQRWIICLACAISLLGVAAPVVNNGGFEGLSGWYYDPNALKPISVSTSVVHDGDCAVLFKPLAGAGLQYIFQDIKLDRKQEYLFSVYVKCQDVPENDLSIRLHLWRTNAQGKMAPYGWGVPTPGAPDYLMRTGGTHDWQKFTCRIQTANLAYFDRLLLFIRRATGSAGKIWIDQLEITPIPQNAPSTPPQP